MVWVNEHIQWATAGTGEDDAQAAVVLDLEAVEAILTVLHWAMAPSGTEPVIDDEDLQKAKPFYDAMQEAQERMRPRTQPGRPLRSEHA